MYNTNETVLHIVKITNTIKEKVIFLIINMSETEN